MNSKLIKPLTKYIIITIFHSMVFFPWNMILDMSKPQTFEALNNFQTYGDLFVKIMTAIFLFVDFKREKLPFTILVCISSLFYPFLGIVVFALLYLEKENKASA